MRLTKNLLQTMFMFIMDYKLQYKLQYEWMKTQ